MHVCFCEDWIVCLCGKSAESSVYAYCVKSQQQAPHEHLPLVLRYKLSTLFDTEAQVGEQNYASRV